MLPLRRAPKGHAGEPLPTRTQSLKSSLHRMKTAVPYAVFVALALTLLGCAHEGATPLNSTSKAAPLPSNATPEQQKQYEAATRQAGPPSKP